MRPMDNRAVSPLLGFVIATLVFSVSFYYVVETAVERQANTIGSEEANYSVLAASVADQILAPGKGWYPSNACVDGLEQTVDGDGMQASGARFGLGGEVCDPGASGGSSTSHRLAFSKVKNIYSAGMSSASNDYADYADARTSLDLNTRLLNFHIRSWPVLASVRQLLASTYQDPNLRPLYIGDYNALSGSTPAPGVVITTTDDTTNDKLVVNAAIENKGSQDTSFTLNIELNLKPGDVVFNLHTGLIPGFQTETTSFTLLKTKDWEWKNTNSKKINWKLSDRVQVRASGAHDISAVAMDDYASNRNNVFAEADQLYFLKTGASVTVSYSYLSYNGKGQLTNQASWTYRLKDPADTVVQSSALPSDDSGDLTFSASDLGEYSAQLSKDDGTVTNKDIVYVVDATPGAYGGVPSYEPGPSVAEEARYVDALFQHFEKGPFSNTYTHGSLPYVAGGDVYPDIKDAMDIDLKEALTDESGNPTLVDYTTLIVGSNVDHNAMTSQAAKGTIKDWVFAGGTLIVFGSDRQQVQWLQPIFHAALDTAGSGISTPDDDHPALKRPNDLDIDGYTPPPTDWEYNAGEGSKFTHVVTTDNGDILAIGNPGAFGKGKVILSSWRPYSLVPDQSSSCPATFSPDTTCEPLFLLHNLVTLSFRELYIDYGPSIPTGSATGAQTREVTVYHPELNRHFVVTVRVFVFPG